MKYAVLIVLGPMLFALFGRLACIPIDILLASVEFSPEASRYLNLSSSAMFLGFGAAGAWWVGGKLWRGMDEMYK